jgi:hypothetical protein
MNKLDEYDEEILADRVFLRGQRTDPLIGDFVLFPDSHSERVSHVRSDGLQTSEAGDFQLCEDGDGGFSGTRNPSIKMEHFADSGTTRLGRFWICHHNMWQALDEIDCQVPCRIWKCDCLRKD